MFLALLPWLLSIMGRVQGLHCKSDIDFSVISKFYIFQVFLSTAIDRTCSSAHKLIRTHKHCAQPSHSL